MPNRPQDTTFVFTLRDGFPPQVTIAIAGCSKEIEETRFIRQSSLVTIRATGKQIVARFTVPVIHIDKKVSLRRQTSRPLLERVTDIRIVQKLDNIARGVINTKPLCLRLGVGTVARALHAQPDCRVRGTSRPLHSSLDQALLLQTRVVQERQGVGAAQDDAASAGRFVGADSDAGSGTSALSSSWFSANRTLFDARPVGASPTRLAAVRRRAFLSSVFLSSPSTRIRHSSVWPCARPPLISALQARGSEPTSCAPWNLSR